MGKKVEFGFYPYPLQLTAGPVTVTPLPDHDEIVARIDLSSVDGDWFFEPIRRIFTLPKTHVIEHTKPTNDDHLVFHLWTLSFFTGIRLTATEAGFLDATPLKPGTLVDFVPIGESLARSIERSEIFWITHSQVTRRIKRFCACIHALFLAQNPNLLEFERFIYLYAACDAFYALAKELHTSSSDNHSGRIKWMCEQYGVKTPTWALPDPAKPRYSDLSGLRNDAFHEALFVEQPLGFASLRDSSKLSSYLLLEMQAVICCLVVALIGGVNVDYVRSPTNTRQRHCLELK
jgi:hypothetical protein